MKNNKKGARRNRMTNTTRIERKGITALEKVLQCSQFIKPEIDKNDKTESWDGSIYLYRDTNWKKENLVGRIPVQIKSTQQHFTDNAASFPVSIADLNNYSTEGGAMLFLISLNTSTDENHIFYISLLTEYINKLLRDKRSQDKVTIKLKRFPENQPEEMECIFHSFLHERSVSANPNTQQNVAQRTTECRTVEEDKNDITSEIHDRLKYLDCNLKEYILQKFEWYKAQNIAVQTPQLLLMLLTYSDDNIVRSIFDIYKTEDGISYGTYLIEFFQKIDIQYKSTGRLYREQHWRAFLWLLKNAEEVLHSRKDKTCITVNILCYAILNYSSGTTVEMIQRQMGKEEFKNVINYILNDALPSVPIDSNLIPYVVRGW